MASRTLLTAAGLMLAAAAPPGSRYVNDRFGFSCMVPAGFVMGRPPDNDDGRMFRSPDGKAELAVYAGFNAAEVTLGTEIGRHLDGCLRRPPEYLVVHRRWAVLSCSTQAGLLYVRTEMRGRGIDAVFTTARMIYPAAERARWDKVAVAAAGSLRAAVPQ